MPNTKIKNESMAKMLNNKYISTTELFNSLLFSLFQEPDGWEIDEITGKISAKGSKFFTPAQITRVNEQYQEKLNEGFTNEEALAEMEE
ncbi:MAG: hypothetical protein ACRC4M_05000, partial [Mycoplasma sp.]